MQLCSLLPKFYVLSLEKLLCLLECCSLHISTGVTKGGKSVQSNPSWVVFGANASCLRSEAYGHWSWLPFSLAASCPAPYPGEFAAAHPSVAILLIGLRNTVQDTLAEGWESRKIEYWLRIVCHAFNEPEALAACSSQRNRWCSAGITVHCSCGCLSRTLDAPIKGVRPSALAV